MGVFAGPDISESGLVLALDVGNKKSYSQNYHPNPLDIYGWYVDIRGNATANNSTITRDSITSPVGNTPLKMVTTGNDSHIGSYNTSAWNLSTAKQGQTWNVSVYAKADISTTGQIFIFEVNSSGNYIQAPAKTINITTEWQRFDYTYTFINANTTHIQTRLDGADTFNGATIWWDGLQVERNSSVSSFTSVYTGENILDISNNSNTGTLTNGPSYSSANGGSLSFDGVDDYVGCGNDASINFGTGDFTVSVWFRRFSNATTNLRLLSKAAGSDTADAANAGFSFFGNNTGISFAVNPTAARTIITAATYSLNEWVNVIGLVERGVSMRTYKNASLVSSTTAPSGSVSGTTSLFIGNNVGANLFWAGEISQVQLYNRALTASEIQQNFNATRGRFGI